jgi:hypothetical protein
VISYVKIYGPPVLEAIKALEKVAIDIPEVCIMDYAILSDLSPGEAEDIGGRAVERIDVLIPEFFQRRTDAAVPVERCQSIISEHGQKLGEYDFFFEWRETPEASQIEGLIERIDKALKPLGCLYTITTKRKGLF